MQRVLIIEDNEDNMKLITFILEKNGYQALQATTGMAGLQMVSQQKPDLVLLDIQLPDLDGTEVLKAIRASEDNGRLPIIAVTSYAMSGDRQRLVEAGCTGYIEKPINPQTIISEIRCITGESP